MDLTKNTNISTDCDVEVSNMLASTSYPNDLNIKLDTFSEFLKSREDIKKVELRDEDTPYTIYIEPEPETESPHIYFHKSSIVVKSVDKYSEIQKANNLINKILSDADLEGEIKLIIKNIVATDTIEQDISLDLLASELDGNHEYDPKLYPALNLRTKIGTNVEVFKSGKLLITGCESVDDAEKTSELVREKIDSLI